MAEIQALRGLPSDTGEGRKFSAEGKPQRFPGNTILCHLTAAALDAARSMADELRAAVGDGPIAWLPPASYHVTLFDGALDARRSPHDWPAGLPLDAPLAQCHALIAERLRGFDLGFEPPIRLVADEAVVTPTLTALPLRAADAQEERRLRELRDRLAQAVGLRHANHDSYNFHMTFGYYVRAFDADALQAYRQALLASVRRFRRNAPVIELGAPEYCLFDDMTEFQTQFLLERQP